MNRIVFLLKKVPNPIRVLRFKAKMKKNGVCVEYRRLKDAGCIPEMLDNALYIVDSPDLYDALFKHGNEPLVYLRSESEIDEFGTAAYFVLDAEETELEYFEKVYRRIHKLPWDIAVTKRLKLRETTEADVDSFYEIYKDPRMTEYTEDLYTDVSEEKRYAAEYRDKVYACQGFGIWTIERLSDGKIIGRAGLTVREGFEGVEIGFLVGCDYQNQGYAGEAVDAVLDFASGNCLEPVYALVMEGNQASIHLLEKRGFLYQENTVVNNNEYKLLRLCE